MRPPPNISRSVLLGPFIMKWRAKAVLILLSTGAMIAGDQSSTQDRGLAQKTQVRGLD
jgi:hypothetical protein